MKFLKYTAVLPLMISLIGVAEAKGEIFYSAPFHNVEITAASKIYVDYHFGTNQALVCTSEQAKDAITSVEWQYKEATRKIGLPVLLKDDNRADGHYADPEGRLVITNEFGAANQGSIFVSCEYSK